MDSANKRIAKNTIYMYIRQFTTMVIGLYTSRLVLEILGVSDYGLFAVVGGVLAMFTFISSSLAGATSRFLNAEMGKKDGDLNAMFNINLLLHIILALIIFVLAETLGIWYVYNKLNVAEGKFGDAIFVYQISILTSCLGIINSPYQSLFNAFERFKFTAILDIVNSIVRLGCILLLAIAPCEGLQLTSSFSLSLLKLYSIIFALTTVNTFVIFHWVAYRDWPYIIRRKFVRGWNRYKEVLSFVSWDTLATLAFMVRTSGTDLTLNKIFGTSVNGAYSIGRSVAISTGAISANVNAAATPQIVQAYSADDKARYTYLANKVGRINILIYELMLFPIIIQLDFILQLWLGKVPEGASDFTFWNLLLSGINVTNTGIYSVIMASGKIKWFRINHIICVLTSIPISWFFYGLGFPAYTILIVFIIADIFQSFIQLIMLRHILGFESLLYVREAYLRPGVIAVIMSLVILLSRQLPVINTFGSLALISFCAVLSITLVLYIGMTREERNLTFIKLKEVCYSR